MSLIEFGLVGGGWRSEFYFRIAQALPETFKVAGVVARNADKGKQLEQTWGIPVFHDLDAMLSQTSPSFVVTSVTWAANPVVIDELAMRGVPVLSETPPAPDLAALVSLYKKWGGAKIQVAEQYQFQPAHAARIQLANSGKLGSVSQAQVSAAHGYHGISLIRKLLGIGFENAAVRAIRFASPLVAGPDRTGGPREEKVTESNQVIAALQFGGKLGIYDFTNDQYFSWIRSQRVLVRGEKGEINNEQVRYLEDFQTPVTLNLQRVNAGEDGNLEGYFHKGILAGTEWVYKNPFVPGRLTDDEIAVAACLQKMDRYAKGGPSFYSLAEASQDHYLSILVNQAVQTGEVIQSEEQAWCRESVD